MLDNKITRWWLKLEPAVQYITWICTFCLMVFVGIGVVVFMANTGYGLAYLKEFLIGIGLFVSFFMFIVLWLTIRWPKIRED